MARTHTTLALKVAGLALLLVSSVAFANGQTKQHKARSPATQASLTQAQQKLQQQQSQVKQLQDALARQESDSKQASDRLQQQDKAIAQMQQELQALQAKQAAGHR